MPDIAPRPFDPSQIAPAALAKARLRFGLVRFFCDFDPCLVDDEGVEIEIRDHQLRRHTGLPEWKWCARGPNRCAACAALFADRFLEREAADIVEAAVSEGLIAGVAMIERAADAGLPLTTGQALASMKRAAADLLTAMEPPDHVEA